MRGDETRVERLDRFAVKTEPLDDARSEILDNHIRALKQCP